MFTKYIVVVDDDVDVHNTGEVLFRLCANTDLETRLPRRSLAKAGQQLHQAASGRRLQTPLTCLRFSRTRTSLAGVGANSRFQLKG
ncbi:MAG: hypothetical protein ABSD57_06965 [Verrucomicrobiota bacterium]